jgi:peptidoglycan/xylan/chitin deacetylase (PgdA/CDA1 family)
MTSARDARSAPRALHPPPSPALRAGEGKGERVFALATFLLLAACTTAPTAPTASPPSAAVTAAPVAAAPPPAPPPAPLPIPVPPRPTIPPANHAERRAQESAELRAHHINRMQERLATAPEVLHRSCRFESEIPSAPPAGRVVITFDDGPEPGNTERILEVLERQAVPATFFLVGSKASRHPELVQRIRASGRHAIGNHSWDHPNFHDLPEAAQADEVLRAEAATGTEPPPDRLGLAPLFRYPYGNSSCPTNDLLHARGYRIVGWHVDSCDWAFDRDGSVDTHEALACGVLAQNRRNFVDHVLASVRAHNGGIVLLHEIHADTVAHLETILERLREAGFRFESIDETDFATSMR